MIENALLKAKSDVQRRISKEVHGDLFAYARRLGEHARAAEVQYDLAFGYEDEQAATCAQAAAGKRVAKGAAPAG